MGLNLEEMKRKIDEWFDSPEGKESVEKTKRWNQREKEYSKIIHNRLIEDSSIIDNFLKHEEKYQEMKYNKHNTCTSSRLFNLIFSIWRKNGVEIEEDYEESDFLAGSFEYLGYKMQVFVGQGSFYRVYKGDECVFQST